MGVGTVATDDLATLRQALGNPRPPAPLPPAGGFRLCCSESRQPIRRLLRPWCARRTSVRSGWASCVSSLRLV